jgi:type II secretory pathway component GspD/PulD (secretin)
MSALQFFSAFMKAAKGEQLTPEEQANWGPVVAPAQQAAAGKKMADAGAAQLAKGEQALAEMRAQNAEQQTKLDKQTAALDNEARQRAERQSATAKARRRGGARALLSAFRLNPEAGLGGADSTLGPS